MPTGSISPSTCRETKVPTLITLHLPAEFYRPAALATAPEHLVPLCLCGAAAYVFRPCRICSTRSRTACRSIGCRRGTPDAISPWRSGGSARKRAFIWRSTRLGSPVAVADRRAGLPVRGPPAIFRRTDPAMSRPRRPVPRPDRLRTQAAAADGGPRPADPEPGGRDQFARRDGGARLRLPGCCLSGRRAARHDRTRRHRLSRVHDRRNGRSDRRFATGSTASGAAISRGGGFRWMR